MVCNDLVPNFQFYIILVSEGIERKNIAWDSWLIILYKWTQIGKCLNCKSNNLINRYGHGLMGSWVNFNVQPYFYFNTQFLFTGSWFQWPVISFLLFSFFSFSKFIVFMFDSLVLIQNYFYYFNFKIEKLFLTFKDKYTNLFTFSHDKIKFTPFLYKCFKKLF